MRKSPKVTVVLVHYGDPDVTSACIDSLLLTAYPELDIIVVDNDPPSGLKQTLSPSALIDYQVPKENKGFAAGNNVGLKKALDKKSEYIWILNNDTQVSPNSISRMVDSFKANKLSSKEAIISPIITYYNSDIIWSNGLYDLPFFNFSKSVDKGKRATQVEQTGTLKPSQYMSGCSLFFHRDLLVKHGLLDERYFMYHEDLSFTRDRTCYYLQEALVQHKVSLSTDSSLHYSPKKALYHGRYSIAYYFYDKKIGTFEKLIFLTVTVWVRALLYCRSLSSFSSYILGMYQGLMKRR